MCTSLPLNQSYENVNNQPDVDNRLVGREVNVIMMGVRSNFYVASRLPSLPFSVSQPP